MSFFHNLSIRQKLVGIIALITIVALVAAFATTVVRDVRGFRREAIESTTLFARVVAQYAVPELVFLDSVSATETLQKMEVVPNVEAAFLFDLDGVLFASWGEGTAMPMTLATGVEVDRGGITVVEPVLHQGERLGTIVVRVSSEPLRRRIRRHLGILFLTLVIVLGVAIGAGYLLQRPISEPILELASTMRRVSLTGDYSLRLQHAHRDEIGTLYTGFNEMLARVQAREQERDQAELRTQEKSRFLANMSHELRTPLNSIIGFSEVLRSHTEGLDDKQARFLEHIHSSGQHLLALINEILDLSKVEAGRVEIHPEPIGLEALLEGVGAVMRGVAGRRGIEVDFAFASDLPVICVDPIKTKQVFYNLLSNAVKFSPDNAEVLVRARRLGLAESPLGEPSVLVSVEDQGIGISPADQERIFGEFVQVDESVGRRFEGTGLGLTLVRAFVEMHDGRVWVESSLGEGSTFYVILPTRYRSVVTEGQQESGPTVVLADGDPAAAEAWVDALRESRCDPLPARTLEAVLGLARNRNPALVVVMVRAEGELDGWEVLEALERDERTKEIPVVICCLGPADTSAICVAADSFFTEPLDFERLQRRVEEVLAFAPEGGTILVVDDDAAAHEVLGKELVNRGHDVVHAWSAKEAREHLDGPPPALVVVDLFIGDMRGLDLAVKVGGPGEAEGIPLIVIAGHGGEDERRRELLRSIATDRRSAPTREVLRATVERLLRRTTTGLPVLNSDARDAGSGPQP